MKSATCCPGRGGGQHGAVLLPVRRDRHPVECDPWLPSSPHLATAGVVAASLELIPAWPAPAVVPTPPKPRRRQVSPPVVPPRRPDAGDDYQGFILALLRDAKEHGEVLRSLELGEALQMQFGPENYKRFREDGLRKAVEQLGFRTVPTSAGFDVELP